MDSSVSKKEIVGLFNLIDNENKKIITKSKFL